MKVILQWSDKYKIDLDAKHAHFMDEQFLYDVPEDIVQKFNELKKQNMEMQEILNKIYEAKHGW